MKKALYSEEHKYLVDRLKQARKDAGIDQMQVANLLDVSQSYISKVEAGQRRIDVIQLKEFAKIYKKTLNFFIK
ncbi:MAG: helix-turn-helix transcriptional regulator [bacterium]|nr:helix-turn-helix transcriptional regulator [bacterium]